MKSIIKHSLLCFMLLWITSTVFAQLAPTCYRLTLTDKNNSPYSINNPSEYLSERAIAKRARFNIAITEQDLPVNPQYIQQIQAVGADIQILCSCKWFNTVTIYCPDSSELQQIAGLPFVSDILAVANYDLNARGPKPSAVPEVGYEPIVANHFRDSIVPYDYGYGIAQIAIHNGQLLHNEGFRGDSMLIAVFDGGWNGMDTSVFFRNLYDEGRLLGTRDLIPWRNYVYDGHYHGTIVTSTMSGDMESTLVGTAPRASYFLIRSEEPDQEQPIEEDFWAQAAVIADSIGADVINSSLGYVQFADFPQTVRTYDDLNGITSIASQAATTLGQKGVVVCVSAGNEGVNEWHRIGCPADATDILAVGAADIYGNIAPFSSRGPSADGRVKPDVTSVGVNTICVFPGDQLGTANGTSLAGPVLAGLCACLWQALPAASSTQIMQYVRESGSCYQNPNDSLGYGIPDFYAAYSQHVGIATQTIKNVEVFPNPTSDFVHIANGNLQISSVEFYNISGQLLKNVASSNDFLLNINIQDLPNGALMGKVHFQDGTTGTFKLMKL